ncbi:MAG TPA: 6-bladed beta-propeller, partial [Bacteroidales bacterium]|nr:6-bladed beta-propeller [Bacteroidales bacterium]
MNLNNTLIVLVILLSIFSCKAQREPAVREYFISHKNAERPVSDIIESYEFIQLEETEGAFFGNARRIILNDGKIIILTGDKRILTFSESGDFIGSIDKQGRGPDEYEVLSDICLDEENGRIIASCHLKVVMFSPEGKILNQLTPGFRFNNVHLTGEGQLLFDIRMPGDKEELNYNLVLTDTDLNLIDSRLPLPLLEGPGLALYGQLNRTSAVPGKDYFFSLRCDTVYRVHEKSIVPGIVLNYDKSVFSITSGTGDPEWEDTYNMIYYSETDDYTVMLFRYENEFYTVLIKDDGEAEIFKGAINISNTYKNSFTWAVYPSFLEDRINIIDPGREKCNSPEMLEQYLDKPEEIGSLLIKV